MPAAASPAASGVPGPPDKAAVIAALRFGWTFAEFRGRNRPVPPHGDDPRVQRDDHALPLRSERTMTEQAIETRMVLIALAQQFDVDTPPVGGRGTKPATYSTQAGQLARVIDGQRQRNDVRLHATWEKLARLMYLWDAHIQDQLTAKCEIQECAYQLGRGLAEAYWSLEAESGADDDPASWMYLLGATRCAELTRLAGRVSAYLDPLTAPVIARTLTDWAAVAGDDAWRGKEAAKQLRQQIRHWYALLVLGQDPETFLRESTLKSKWQLTLRALKLYAGELIVGALGAIAVGGAAALIATDRHHTVWKVALAVFAFLGISGATIQARLKTVSQALITRLREKTYVDLVAEAVTVRPPKPGRSQRLGRAQ
jgi:hypothetical protein